MSIPTNHIISLSAGTNVAPVAETTNQFSVTEGTAEGFETKMAEFTVNLSTASDHPVSVSYTTIDQSAKDRRDYEKSVGTITFEPGETSKTFNVPIIKDNAIEGDEKLKVVLHSAVGGTVYQATNFLTILDDDVDAPTVTPKVMLGAQTVDVVEGAEGAVTMVRYPVTLDQPVDGPVSVSFTTIDQTAQDRRDYDKAKGTITFEAGQTESYIEIPVLDDAAVEDTESLKVVLFNPEGAELGAKVGFVNIADNDSESEGPVDGGPTPINIITGEENVDDTLEGLPGFKNFIAGLSGNDTLIGNSLSDTLTGGDDTGSLILDETNTLVSSVIGDTLAGGAGPDTFKYSTGSGFDNITDFEDNVDKLVLTGAHTLIDATIGGSQWAFADFGGGDGVLVEGITAADLADDIIIA